MHSTRAFFSRGVQFHRGELLWYALFDALRTVNVRYFPSTRPALAASRNPVVCLIFNNSGALHAVVRTAKFFVVNNRLHFFLSCFST